MRIFKPVGALLLSCFLLVGGIAAYWYYSMKMASENFAAMVEQSTGGKAQIGAVQWDFSPWQVRFVVHDLSLTLEDSGHTYTLWVDRALVQHELFSDRGLTIKFAPKMQLTTYEGAKTVYDVETEDAVLVLLQHENGDSDFTFSAARSKVFVQSPLASIATNRVFLSAVTDQADGKNIKISVADLVLGKTPEEQLLTNLIVFEGTITRVPYLNLARGVGLLNIHQPGWKAVLEQTVKDAAQQRSVVEFANVQFTRPSFWFTARMEGEINPENYLEGQISCTTNNGPTVVDTLDKLRVVDSQAIMNQRVFRTLFDRLDVVTLDFNISEHASTLNGIRVGGIPQLTTLLKNWNIQW